VEQFPFNLQSLSSKHAMNYVCVSKEYQYRKQLMQFNHQVKRIADSGNFSCKNYKLYFYRKLKGKKCIKRHVILQ
jgi:hypothetical protein